MRFGIIISVLLLTILWAMPAAAQDGTALRVQIRAMDETPQPGIELTVTDGTETWTVFTDATGTALIPAQDAVTILAIFDGTTPLTFSANTLDGTLKIDLPPGEVVDLPLAREGDALMSIPLPMDNPAFPEFEGQAPVMADAEIVPTPTAEVQMIIRLPTETPETGASAPGEGEAGGVPWLLIGLLSLFGLLALLAALPTMRAVLRRRGGGQ